MEQNSAISRMTLAIVRAARPEQVILFGSQAKGSAHRQSDFDLALVFQSTAELREGIRSAHRALWPREYPVDIVGLTVDSIRHGSSVLAREVKTSGRILYDRADKSAAISHVG